MQVDIVTHHSREVIDITDEVARTLPAGTGILHIFIQHTTCAVTTMDIDPGTDQDLLDALAELLPHKQWRHPHDNSYTHVTAHLLSAIIGPSVCVPYANGQLQLGTWQRVILIELDGPRERKVVLTAIPAKA